MYIFVAENHFYRDFLGAVSNYSPNFFKLKRGQLSKPLLKSVLTSRRELRKPEKGVERRRL